MELGSWRGSEESSMVRRPGMCTRSPVYRVRSFLPRTDVETLCDFLAGADDYDIDSDSVDAQPTFEFYPFQKGQWCNDALRTLLADFVENRLLPYVRQRYGLETIALSEILVRRYLPKERRTHAAHYDGHAFATAVLGLTEPSEYQGGLYLQPGPHVSTRRIVRLDPGDLFVHSFNLQHGVEVAQGSRYSLIFWLKDSPMAVAEGTTPWYAAGAFGAFGAQDADALYNLGVQHQLGLHGKDVDPAKALEAYLCSAELGHHFSQNNLALLYQEYPELASEGCGTAMTWMRRAAESGFAVAQKNLGTMLMDLEEGNSVVAAESHQWLRRAAAQREPEAAFFLGEIYRQGLGVPPDRSEAESWYRASAELGCPRAFTELGMLDYESGCFADAERQFEAAVHGGDVEAWGYLATVRMCLGKCSSAVAIWKHLAAHGDAEAQFHLGTCFLRGSGVGMDKQKALQHLETSCAAGNERAKALLRELEGDRKQNGLVRSANMKREVKGKGSEGWKAQSDNKVGIAQAAQELSDELSEIESAIDEDADPSYSEDFADGTGTGTLDRSEPRQSVAASPLASPRSRTSEKDASYSEDFAEATLEATLEEALPSAEVQHPALNRRQEIALRQQADAKRTVIVPAVSDEDDIEEEDIPEGGDFSEDDLEASGSMYDPEARRREMEKEAQRQEEEERLRKEQEQAEQARKQREIDEANRRLAAERKRKLEEEEEAKRRVEEEAYRKKQEEELRRAEAARKEEEQRRKTEEEARKREEQRQKAEEEERKQAEEEIRKREEEEERKKAAEESRKREEEQGKKVEEEMRKREEEERKQAAEESRKREEEQRAKAEEEMRKREEEERKQAAEESRKREEEQRAKAEEERRKREEEEEERKKAEEEARKRRDEEEERGEAGEAAEIKRRKQEDPGQAEPAPLDDARSKDRLVASSTSSTSSTSKEGAPASPASKKLCEENSIADGARTAMRDQPAGQARDNSELLKGTVNGFEDSPTRPGLRRFSGAWIQTELDLASAPVDQVYEGGESQASHVGPELPKHLGSPQWDSRDAWSSPKHRQMQWNRDYRSRQRDQTDQTEETNQRWSWEANSGHTDWEEWRHDERNGDESGEWRRKRRNGDWWDWTDSTYSADWAEPRRSEDVRLLFEANGRQGWERFSGQDAATWSQRRSRAMWQEPEEPESPGQRWHGKSRSGQADREGLWSQLEELDRERAHRSPSHASGLWQPPPRAWESHFADLPSGHRPSDRVSAPHQPPGFYGHPTPFGVLYPWGFAGYSVPAPGPWKQPIVDSLTLSPTGSRPAASPNTPGPPPAASDRQLEPRPRAWSGLDNVEQRAPLPSGATTDPLPVEVPPPPGPSVLETTLALGSRDLDFQESLVGSLAAVVDEMLQFKYGCSIDTVDYRTKLLGFCDATLCSIPRLVEFANSQKDFFALTAFAGNDPENNREMQMRLRLTCQELASFGDLSQRLRLLAGTASAVVIISTRGGYAVQALAAFRTSCSDARCAVGRCPARGRVLEHFSAEEFCSAVALEPVILSQAPLGSAFASDPPALTEEFRNLQQLLEGRQGPLSRVAKPLSPQLLAALHARAPNALAFRHVAVALASTDVQPEVVGELFRRLVEWFRIKSLSAAQTALAEAPAHVALVACLRRSVERHDLCELGCQLLARAARHHVENAAAFVRAGAPQLVCQILGRHFDFKEVQRHGLQAIAILAHYGGWMPRLGARLMVSVLAIKLAPSRCRHVLLPTQEPGRPDAAAVTQLCARGCGPCNECPTVDGREDVPHHRPGRLAAHSTRIKNVKPEQMKSVGYKAWSAQTLCFKL
ncbi:unnamed protein product [Symbiodinium natans]|uniref:Fe2OG dioxygenase domain-containing protein n=1 Tax=Symbiodinium natans TaxID=878477 RepID=A0A812IA95_9DINO|nr:unnamed protein product [Symbiodinium natans]